MGLAGAPAGAGPPPPGPGGCVKDGGRGLVGHGDGEGRLFRALGLVDDVSELRQTEGQEQGGEHSAGDLVQLEAVKSEHSPTLERRRQPTAFSRRSRPQVAAETSSFWTVLQYL